MRHFEYACDYLTAVLRGSGGLMARLINVITLVVGIGLLALVAWLAELDPESFLLGFVAFVALLAHYGPFIAYRDLRRKVAEYEGRPRPVFKFVKEWVDRREIETPSTGYSRTIQTMPANYSPSEIGMVSPPIPVTTGSPNDKRPYFAHVTMCNDPPMEWRRPEADATKVFPSITFFRWPENESLFRIDGRWGCCSRQPAAQSPLDSIEHMREVDFPANGTTHDLDIAIKHPGDKSCYAFSSASFFAPNGCRPEWKLSGERFRVEVTLKGHGVEQTVNYILVNLGGQELTIERLFPDSSSWLMPNT